MTTTGGRATSSARPRPGAVRRRAPRPAPTASAHGRDVGSGYREPPALARRGDGQVVQLTPLLYARARRPGRQRGSTSWPPSVSPERPAATVSADNVAHARRRSCARSACRAGDGRQPELQRSNPLLALRFKAVVTDPERTRRLTDPVRRALPPDPGGVVLAVFVRSLVGAVRARAWPAPPMTRSPSPACCSWCSPSPCSPPASTSSATPPPLAAAAPRPAPWASGLYLIWPAFYTDVTDSYRLGRGGRLRTDLGGLYFNALVVSAPRSCGG